MIYLYKFHCIYTLLIRREHICKKKKNRQASEQERKNRNYSLVNAQKYGWKCKYYTKTIRRNNKKIHHKCNSISFQYTASANVVSPKCKLNFLQAWAAFLIEMWILDCVDTAPPPMLPPNQYVYIYALITHAWMFREARRKWFSISIFLA